jgi:ubiquinone/menaquinone biosynthesis C-methylase UbiE
MVTGQSGIDLLKKGIVLPQHRILSSFLDNILSGPCRMLDLNCDDGSLYEVVDFFFPYKIDYVGVDQSESSINMAMDKNLPVQFKHLDYSKLKLRENSYDVIVVQNEYFGCGDLLKKIDTLFRASRRWVVFYSMYVIPECDSYRMLEVDGEDKCVYGINYIKETLSLMEPFSVEYSYIVKAENPTDPIPSIFAIKL